ncbi:undecaprenyl-diphosphate phosphatase, partial [Candidatus Peregrinibacteria bacterium]|nr:undecaprenyl-diphosphate phosphatase [Candidatus Peregrinibacteria bacterium]
MTLLQAFLLGILQGITEFLPISSSGHLLMAQSLFGLNDLVALKSFDIAVHFGTLLAILIYFRKDFWNLIKGFLGKIFSLGKKVSAENEANFNLAITLILATIPAILAGLFLEEWLDSYFYNAVTVPIMLVVVGVVFLVAEKIYKKNGKARTEITRKEGLGIGLAQTLALIPGVSRSGSTITA